MMVGEAGQLGHSVCRGGSLRNCVIESVNFTGPRQRRQIFEHFGEGVS